MTAPFRIRGAGGGGGGKGKSGSSSNADNTLRSNARARMVEVISEGEIVGLIDGNKSIYFDQTPVANDDGSENFKNVIWSEHKGLPDDGAFNGVSDVETPVDVNVQVKKATGAVSRTIVDTNATAARLIMRIPALAKQDKKSGSLKATSLSYQIDVRGNAGTWQTVVTKDIKNEKTTSPYQIAHRVDLPEGGSPWDIRVTRLTDDSDAVELQNDLFWDAYIILVEGKFTYPHTAAVALEVNAEDMGQSIPDRSYRVKGLKINVPSNYDPDTRTYTGNWDGTFKIAWTNNPAWVFYDLLVNDRYGLGEFINPAIVDKWSLYTIAQYCDQLVPSGYKNADTGADIMEPRFTFNGVINSRDDAYFVLQQISTAWRGMAFWSIGQIFASADMPADAFKVVAPANVIDGAFEYSGTAVKARHSVCLVRWNDPDDFYRAATEVVIDDEALKKWGWREKELQLTGCTSRGLAHRYGKWVLDVEQNETETVEYSAAWDHAELRPGHIIAIADPKKANVRLGGRIKGHAGNAITLDFPFEAAPGASYKLMLTMPDGTVETKPIASFTGTSTVNVSEAFSKTAVVDAMFVITGTDVVPRQYRVLSVTEDQPNIFKVQALFHDPNKYARVEQNIRFDPLPYSRPKNVTAPPTDLKAQESSYVLNGVRHSRILFSWSPNQYFISKGFRVVIETPDDGEISYQLLNSPSIQVDDVEAGKYVLHVQTVSLTGLLSDEAVLEYTAAGPTGIPMPTVTNLRLVDRPTAGTFVGKDVYIVWDNNFASSSVSGADDNALSSDPSSLYSHNTIKVYDTPSGKLLRTARATTNLFIYTLDMNRADTAAQSITDPSRSLHFEVTVTDTFGRESEPATKYLSNPVPEAITPMITASDNSFYAHWSAPADDDFVGVLVWVSGESGFDPLATDPTYDLTATNFVIVPASPSTVYYVRIAAYDAFGKTGLNISQEIEVSTFAEFDMTPPAVPTGLALSSALDGDQTKLTASWDANTEDDLAGYIVAIKEGSGNFVEFPTGLSTSYSWSLPASTAVTVKVLAFDRLNNRSAFTSEENATTVADTVPPAVPTNVKAEGGFNVIWLSFDPNTEIDLAKYEVYQSASSTAPTTEAAATFLMTSNQMAITDAPTDVDTYFWVRAVDLSGNKSAWSTMASAKALSVTPTITTADLEGLVDQTSFAQTVAVPGRGDTLPAITSTTPKQWYLTTDKLLYVQKADGSGWIKQTDASLIIGQIQAGQIGANAVGAKEIAADSISASKLVLTDTTNLIPDDQMTDIAAWSTDAGSWPASLWTNNGPSQLGSKNQWYYTVPSGGSAYGAGLLSSSFPIDSSKQYYFAINAYAATSGQAVVLYRVQWIAYDGSSISLETIGQPTIQAGINTKISASLTPPANAASAVMQTYVYLPDTTCPQVFVAQPVARVMASAELIVNGAIRANHIATDSAVITGTAQIADAIVTNAKVVSLDAVKLTAGSIASNNALIGLINGANVKIAPGQILISGSTTLSNWIYGGDGTSINGGAIAASTININKLTAGLRGITVNGIAFTANSPSANWVSWTAGTITYMNDDGSLTTENIAAGSGGASLNAAIVFIRGRGVLNFLPADTYPTYQVTGGAEECVVLAKYAGGTSLTTNIGQTIVDGDHIKTGSITAAQADITSFRAAILIAGSITATMLQVGRASNCIENSDFTAGTARWTWGGSTPNFVQRLRNDGVYNVPNHPCFEIYDPNSTYDPTSYVDVYPLNADGTGGFVCVPGQRYEISAYINTHRCKSAIYISFWDANNNFISNLGYQEWPATNLSGGTMAMFVRRTTFVTAPANAAKATPTFRKLGTDAGGADSYMFLYRCQFAEAAPNQTEPSPWSSNGITQIAGDVVRTGSITADKADIATFKAVILTASSITAEMLAIGTSGNMIGNSDFRSGSLLGITYGADGGAGAPSYGVNSSPWFPVAMGAAYIAYAGIPPTGPGGFAQINNPNINGSTGFFPVDGGQRYEFSTYLSIHRCNAYLRVIFFDASGNVVGDVNGNTCAENIAGNVSLSGWSRSGLFVTAPANASRCYLRVQMIGTGGTNPYVFFTGLYMGKANPYQYQLSPWSPGSATVIDGRGIYTPNLAAISATIGTFQSAPSGARVVISDTLLMVYDANNVLRVRLGIW